MISLLPAFVNYIFDIFVSNYSTRSAYLLRRLYENRSACGHPPHRRVIFPEAKKCRKMRFYRVLHCTNLCLSAHLLYSVFSILFQTCSIEKHIKGFAVSGCYHTETAGKYLLLPLPYRLFPSRYRRRASVRESKSTPTEVPAEFPRNLRQSG